MGILTHAFLKLKMKEKEREDQNKQRVASSKHVAARQTILRIYHVDIDNMGDQEKKALKKKIQDQVVKSIKKYYDKKRSDPKILNNIRRDLTREYGVDKELLAEVNKSLFIFRDDRMEEAVYLMDASQEVQEIAGDYLYDDIIKQLEEEYRDLVMGHVIKFGFGDGDEGVITYEIKYW